MIASVHLADVGFPASLAVLRKAPKPKDVPGLRHAEVAVAAPLGGSALPAPQVGRVGLIAFWEDDAALDRFLDGHRLAQRLGGGWRIRLEPLRAFGAFPGLPADVARPRTVTEDGPAAVLTLGRFKWHRAVPFFRTSRKAELAVVDAPGLAWAMGMARPPFVATCSLWESGHAAAGYAYGPSDAPHQAAIDTDRAKPFHRQEAFIRFRPYDSVGRLEGKNPLPERWLSTA